MRTRCNNPASAFRSLFRSAGSPFGCIVSMRWGAGSGALVFGVSWDGAAGVGAGAWNKDVDGWNRLGGFAASAAGVEAEKSEPDVAGLAASAGFSCAGAALGLGAKMFANGF